MSPLSGDGGGGGGFCTESCIYKPDVVAPVVTDQTFLMSQAS